MPGYSLWLAPEPDSPEGRLLEDRIEEYAGAYDDAPAFDPHLTVVGGADVDASTAVERTRDAADGHGPVEVSLVRPHCSTTRYQCVFLLADPTADLLALREDARRAFERDPSMYTPHLSLLYSDVDVDERRRLVEGFDADLPVAFTADHVQVVDTRGGVGEWSVVERVPL